MMRFDELDFDQHGNPFRRSTQSSLGRVDSQLADTTLAMRALLDRLHSHAGNGQEPLCATGFPTREVRFLELGFGAGVNFMVLRREWLSRRLSQPLCYCAIEPSPLAGDGVSTALHQLGFAPSEVRPLVDQWPAPLTGLHCLEPAPGIRLFLLFNNLETGLRRIPALPDALVLSDPAITQHQPGPPTQTAAALASVIQPGTQIVTARLSRSWADVFASKAIALHRGDRVAVSVAGYLHGVDTRTARHTRQASPVPGTNAMSRTGNGVLVVGAGLAGTTIARALVRAGLPVRLVDTMSLNEALAPQQQPAIAAHLHLAADDNPLARLSRAALALTSRHGGTLRYPGRLQLDSSQTGTLQRAALRLPASVAVPVDKSQASDLAGLPVTSGGLWLPGLPVRVAEDQPSDPNETLLTSALVTELFGTDAGWTAHCNNGQSLGPFSRVVIATGLPPALAGLDGIVPTRSLSETVVAGLSSTVAVTNNTLRCVVSDRHYAIPLTGGQWLAGASYHPVPALASAEVTQRVSNDHAANLAGVCALLQEPARYGLRITGTNLGRRVMLPDRLPIIGPAPDIAAIDLQRQVFVRNDRLALPTQPGLYLALGLGSRGLLWSCLAAQMVVDWFTGRTVPLESDLRRAVSADRFVRRMLRREQQK